MKKIIYQTPEVKVKALFMDQLLQGSGVYADGADVDSDYAGADVDGSKDPDAKVFDNSSVWDD